jgi:hypothetical protein
MTGWTIVSPANNNCIETEHLMRTVKNEDIDSQYLVRLASFFYIRGNS